MTEIKQRKGREGSRWINYRPDSKEVAEWFKTVPIHDGLEHDRYVSGVVLIPAEDKRSKEVVGFDAQGAPIVTERNVVSYVPYVRADVRTAYFYDYLRLHPEWLGSIEPVTTHYAEDMTKRPALPPGFFRHQVQSDQGVSTFIAATMRIKIYVRDTVKYDGDGRILGGEPVAVYPPATKTVSTTTKWGVDSDSLMKAETGAVGRALGMAGMLVVPGSGASTAEDMVDAPVVAAAGAVSAAIADPEDVSLIDQIEEATEKLKAASSEKFAQYQRWLTGRRFAAFEELPDRDLHAILKSLNRALDHA